MISGKSSRYEKEGMVVSNLTRWVITMSIRFSYKFYNGEFHMHEILEFYKQHFLDNITKVQ